jgi:hypothetical protein
MGPPVDLARGLSDLFSLGFRLLVIVVLVDRLAERCTDPCLDVSLGNQNHNWINTGHLIVLTQFVTALLDSIVICVNDNDEEGIGVCLVPLPTSNQLLWKLTEHPPDVSTVD